MICTRCDGEIDVSTQGHFYFCPSCKSEYHNKERGKK